MRLLQFICLATCLSTVVACKGQPSVEADASLDAASSQASSGDGKTATGGGQAITDAAVPAVNYGSWLTPPAGLDSRYSQPYPVLVQSAEAGDPSGLMNLALLSQQIASHLAREGKVDEAYEFILQSGRALRAGMPGGAQFLPEEVIANIYFNEASALSRSGQAAASLVALEDAFASGFSELTAIEQEPELAPVRAMEGFSARLEAWRSVIQQRAKEEAKRNLQAAESFPFTFAGTDVHGLEQSLVALEGKVVIVDFWGTWCPPCRAEIPDFVKLKDQYASEGFEIVGLTYERKDTEEENRQGVLDFAKEFSINYPCLLGDEATREQVPNFRGFPTTLFIDRTGKVRLQVVGQHSYEFMNAVVSLLMAESA